jgi:hypothetical protein
MNRSIFVILLAIVIIGVAWLIWNEKSINIEEIDLLDKEIAVKMSGGCAADNCCEDDVCISNIPMNTSVKSILINPCPPTFCYWEPGVRLACIYYHYQNWWCGGLDITYEFQWCLI